MAERETKAKEQGANAKTYRRPAHPTLSQLFGLLVVFLGGCSLGPNFRRPEMAQPASLLSGRQQTDVASRPVSAPIPLRWWRLFQDPELTALEAQVAAQNLDVRQASLRIIESRAEEGIAGGPAYPSFEANASYTREKASNKGIFAAAAGGSGVMGGGGGAGTVASGAGSEGGAGGVSSAGLSAFNLFQAGFDSVWELDLWGKVRRAVEAAAAGTEAALYDRRAVLLSVEAEVARDYIGLRGVQRQLAITRVNLTTAQGLLRLTEDQEAAGLATDLDVARARAEAASISAQIPPLEQQQTQAINRLSFLLGKQPSALANELATVRPIPPVPPQVPVGLPAELLRRRPDIREAEAKLHAATANIGLAIADLYPDVSLTGSVGTQATKFANLFDLSARQWAFGPSVTLPIFEGGGLSSEVTLHRAQAKEAAIAWQQTVLTALEEVDDALTAYRDEQRRRVSLATAVGADKQALLLARERYEQGISSYIDVLDAQRNVLEAELAEATSTTTVSTDLVALYKALGGGWPTEPTLLPAPAPL